MQPSWLFIWAVDKFSRECTKMLHLAIGQNWGTTHFEV